MEMWKKAGMVILTLGVGAGILYWLTTRKVEAEIYAEPIEPGRTIEFEHIPGVPGYLNIRAFLVPSGFGYGQASDIVADIEGGTGTGTGSPSVNISKVMKWNNATQNWVLWQHLLSGWTGTDFSIEPGDILGIMCISSFTWTVL